MATETDRLKGAFRALARGAFPEALYSRVWRAKMVRQKSALRVDVEPYDLRLPPMANIPLKVGAPGVEVKIPPGHDVAVGWEDGRPDRPYATQWTPGLAGTKPLEVTMHADSLNLGGPAEEQVILGTSYRTKELRVDATILAFCQALALAVANDSAIPAPYKAAVATMMTELNKQIIEFNLNFYLSDVVRTV